MKIIRLFLCTRIGIPIFGAKKNDGYIMENWLERANEKFLDYDPNVWVREFFDPETGGYVVTHKKRINQARKSKRETIKYNEEMSACMVFARDGHKIELVDEALCELGKQTYDAIIDGNPADIKHIKGENNIVRNAKKAIDKQGAEVLMFQFDKNTERVHLELLKLKRRGYKVMYFFSEEQKVNIL